MLGEFYWRLRKGEKTRNTDYAAGVKRLNREQVGQEVTWSAGGALDSDAVAKAFGLGTVESMAMKRDAQAVSGSGRGALFWVVAAVIIVVVVMSMAQCGSNGCQPLRDSFGEASAEYQQCLRSQRSSTYKNASNGNVVVEIRGGSQPYLTNWANGCTELRIKNLPSALYQVTVTDAHQCQSVHDVLISQPVASGISMKKHLLEEVSVVSVNPNPAKDHVNINSVNEKLISVTLYDTNGKNVKSAFINSETYKMDIKDLTTGFYTMIVVTQSGTQLQKIAKTN